jgi:hypothetical protein
MQARLFPVVVKLCLNSQGNQHTLNRLYAPASRVAQALMQRLELIVGLLVIWIVHKIVSYARSPVSAECICLVEAVVIVSKLRRIPSVGPDGLFSYLSAFKFIFKANAILHEGYGKHYPKAFKVAKFDAWVVYVTGADMLEDMRTAPEDVLSFEVATAEVCRISSKLLLPCHLVL